MKHDPNFDVDAVLRTLGTVSEKYQDGSPEAEALRVAAVALIFVRDTAKLGDYRQFFERFYTPAIHAVRPSHSFASRKEADEWLAGGTGKHGELVSIAGEGFQVVHLPSGPRFLRTPLPAELEPWKPK